MSVTLVSLAQGLEQLPLANQGRIQPVAQDEVPSGSGDEVKETDWRAVLQAIWTNIRSLVVIKRRDHKVMPLLAPEQRFFLYQNVRLKLETARLALLLHDTPTYRASLQDARNWIMEYFEPEHAATTSMLQSLTRLEETEIDPALPVFSQSLHALRQHGRSDPRPPAGQQGEGAP